MAARRRKSRKPGTTRRAARRSRAKSNRKTARRPKPARREAPKQAKAAKNGSRPKPKQPRASSRATPVRHASLASPARLVTGAPIEVGVVLHYYPRAAAAVVALSRPIHRGDTIHVRGQTTDFVQPVQELALEGAPVAEGAPPQQIGVRFEQRARAGDRVYRVSW